MSHAAAGPSDQTEIVVRSATVDEILPVRKAVLRPDEPVEPSAYDRVGGVQHVGAFERDVAVGCVTVYPAPYEKVADAWQLRGMAVSEGRRGAGIGALVLQRAIDVVRAAGVPLLWANARVPALPFYRRHGFEVVSEEFAYGPAAIPHRVIVFRLSDEGRTVAGSDFPR